MYDGARRVMRIALLLLLTLACTRATSSPAETRVASKLRLSEIVGGLEVPWSIAFAPDGRMLVTERPGRLRAVRDGKLDPKPLHVFTDVVSRSEEGLMGLVLHPNFKENGFLYVSYTARARGELIARVVRYRDAGSGLADAKTIVDHIPAARFHAGCRLKFGPDGKLYITTGDATERDLAQDPDSLAGKILRLNDDGTIPHDNPIKGSPVFTLGHRNSQGIDWDPKTGRMVSTEHGPSFFDGPPGGDEVNYIVRGKNYGWPLIHHRKERAGLESPIAEYTPAHAPASAAFWRGDFYFGCLRGNHLHRLRLDPNVPQKVLEDEELFSNLGRIREVAAGPDGALYFSTSNRDGRGDPATTDDRIFRVE